MQHAVYPITFQGKPGIYLTMWWNRQAKPHWQLKVHSKY